MNESTRTAVTWVIVIVFTSQLFVNVMTLVFVIYKAAMTTKHMERSESFQETAKLFLTAATDMLQITKMYYQLVASARKETSQTVVREAEKTRDVIRESAAGAVPGRSEVGTGRQTGVDAS